MNALSETESAEDKWVKDYEALEEKEKLWLLEELQKERRRLLQLEEEDPRRAGRQAGREEGREEGRTPTFWNC